MKKNNKILTPIVLMGLSVVALASCKPQIEADPLSNMTTLADFSQGMNQALDHSHGWSNGEPFDVIWDEDLVQYSDGKAKLSIVERDEQYYAGEIRSDQFFGFGDYEVRMKPSKDKGTASTFFICTGPYDTDENNNPNPHDEIDIEFLGKDTTKVQFNFFVDGKGGNEYMYDLGFDASLEFHNYGFRWEEDKITWFVDGAPVYQVKKTKNKELPSTPGRILMNYWSGTEKAWAWMGKFDGPKENSASEYEYVKTSATPIGEIVVEEEKPVDTLDWSKVGAIKGLEFASSDGKHTITSNEEAYTFDYSNVAGGSYNNVMASLGEASKDTNWAYMKIKNNGSNPATVRIDLLGTPTNPTTNNTSVCNIQATMDGNPATTDLEWGGTTFGPIAAGKEVEAVIYYEGIASQILAMLDSSTYEDTNTYNGSVTISDIKFAKQGELKLPEIQEPDPTPDPEPGEPSIPEVDEGAVALDFSTDFTGYKIINDAENKRTSVSYENVEDNTWTCMFASLDGKIGTNNTIELQVTNMGEETNTIRIDTGTNGSSLTTHITGVISGGEYVSNEKFVKVVVAPGQTASVKFTVDNSKVIDGMNIFLDSGVWANEVKSHNGNIVIGNVKFSGGESSQPEPKPEPKPSDIIFNSTPEYTVTPSEGKINVTYSNVLGQSYKNIVAGVSSIANLNNTLSVKVKNNGTESVRLRIDVQATTWISTTDPASNQGTDACNVSGGEYTDTNWGGTFQTIKAGAEITITIKYNPNSERGAVKNLLVYLDSSCNNNDAHSGNVTLSEFVFSKIA